MPAEIRRGAEAALPGDLLDRQGTGLQQFAGAQDALLGEPFNVPFVIFAVIAGAAVLPRQAGRGVARRPDVAGPCAC